ncbi:hypothetical protein JT359_02670 [Candidatus Poribacteria bacterium]|nr:hypothetical protein [Candidatus Poribacteria bacterium]
MYKSIIIYVVFTIILTYSVESEFLPEDNSDAFGLEYGESIAGIPPSTPKIDGKLNDWIYAVWVSFDSEK